MQGKAPRAGSFQCNSCREQFTVTIGTGAERGKISLNKRILAICMISAGKTGMSARQLHRILGISYKSTWCMVHRIREAMREGKLSGGWGGQNRIVEVHETYIGGRESNKHKSKRRKDGARWPVDKVPVSRERSLTMIRMPSPPRRAEWQSPGKTPSSRSTRFRRSSGPVPGRFSDPSAGAAPCIRPLSGPMPRIG
jgi:hypothetical protein